MIAVITGDIVFSSSAKSSETWRSLLKDIFRTIERRYEVLGGGVEMHRGDGFQMGLAHPEQSLEVALLLRAGLIKDPGTPKNMDARLAIGIGEFVHFYNSVNEADGEVFRRSGHTLDAMKKEVVRIALSSPDADFDEEMKISFSLADTLIRNWSKADAEIVWYSLVGELTQAEIAEELGISQPAVSKRKSRAHIDELILLMERFSAKVNKMMTAYE